MSIRLRLSLLYSTILAITLAALGVVLYTTQSQYTLNWLKQDLLVSSETLSQTILQNYLSPKPPTAGGQAAPPQPSLSLTGDQAFQQQSQQEIVRVLDPDGALVASPVGSTEINLPLGAEALQALRNQQDWWATASVSGTRLLIYSRPVVFQGRVISILQVGRALTERDQSLQSLGRTLVIATLIAMLSAFGLSWLLAGTALRPVRRIAQTAQDIGGARDFSRRVDYSGPPDEVGRLASTFNGMLAQLQDAYQKIAHALEMQRNFVADVSHELRTPLTTLRGNLGLLSRTPPIPAEDQTDILQDMVEESDRLIRLVNDLLALARADAGRSLAKAAVAVRPLMEEACRQARQLDRQRQISLDAPEDLTIAGDRDAFKQVLLILLDNALKHSQGAIQLSARAQGKDGPVELRVEDFGEGIPAGEIEHVFDRFYRGEEQQSVPGLGLGLPIAKALVENMGGTITIKSEIGKGTALTLSFPSVS